MIDGFIIILANNQFLGLDEYPTGDLQKAWVSDDYADAESKSGGVSNVEFIGEYVVENGVRKLAYAD